MELKSCCVDRWEDGRTNICRCCTFSAYPDFHCFRTWNKSTRPEVALICLIGLKVNDLEYCAVNAIGAVPPSINFPERNCLVGDELSDHWMRDHWITVSLRDAYQKRDVASAFYILIWNFAFYCVSKKSNYIPIIIHFCLSEASKSYSIIWFHVIFKSIKITLTQLWYDPWMITAQWEIFISVLSDSWNFSILLRRQIDDFEIMYKSLKWE